MAHLILRSFTVRGGGVRTQITGMTAEPAFVGVIVGVDFLGGVALGIAASAIGLSSPDWLLNWVEDTPPLGWAAIGVLGPAVADRAISGSLVRGRFEPLLATRELTDEELREAADSHSISSSAWRLRHEAVRAVEDEIWVVVQRTLTAESLGLRDKFESLLETDLRTANELPRLTREHAKRNRLPAAVHEACDRITGDCSEESLTDLLDALANELIRAQAWAPLKVLVGSTSRPRRTRRSSSER